MSKLTGNQEFNGDVYVKGVGGYDGTTPEGTLQEFLICENLTEDEWWKIFNEEGLFLFYIDDFPEEKLDEIISVYGATSLDGAVKTIASMEPSELQRYGVNFFMPTCETMEYENKTYRLYTQKNKWDGVGHTERFALLPIRITFDELYKTSMLYDSSNRECPFVMVSLSQSVKYTAPLGNEFSLICAKQISPWKKPIDASRGEEITYMYMDDFTCDGASLVQVIKEHGETFDDYLTFIKENPDLQGATNRFAKEGTIAYEGDTYDIWIKTDDYDGEYGGLAPQNLTYSQLYPHTLECDSDNAFKPYCPFIAFYENGNISKDRYEGKESLLDKYSNLIAIE